MSLSVILVYVAVAFTVAGWASALKCIDDDKRVTFTTTEFARENCALRDSKDYLITVVLLYHNECESLKFATSEWIGLPKSISEKVRFLVIDNHSRFPASSCVSKGAPVDIARVDSDPVWNIGGARNLGAFLSCSDFLFITDIDAYMSKKALQSAVHHVSSNPSDKSTIYQYNRHFGSGFKVHPGIMVISRDWYWAIHGCDEDFVGHYGMTDPHLKYRSGAANGKMVHLQKEFLCHIDSHEDSARSKELPAQDRSNQHNTVLFEEKRSGKVPWNHTILRFDWHMVAERPEQEVAVVERPQVKLVWQQGDDSAPALDPKTQELC